MSDRHATTDELASWLEGDIEDEAARALERHVETCPSCAAEVERTATVLAHVAAHGEVGEVGEGAARESGAIAWLRRVAAAAVFFAAGMAVQAAFSRPAQAPPDRNFDVGNETPPSTQEDTALARTVSERGNGLARGLVALRSVTRK